ncbi:hypothetical protein KY290_001795 [Solanum tuberosum]|uniref:Uncharacterized protein n=1 Tax=Solanum tuberosum TaxID=4113 RepID=A0ABQ7WN75_SOLTU|nr:hypothetical protein KY290_001795 [Solanum tuberosum]
MVQDFIVELLCNGASLTSFLGHKSIFIFSDIIVKASMQAGSSLAICFSVHAFVAPKIIGGKNAPSPVGELGMVEMTQALELIDVCYEQV